MTATTPFVSFSAKIDPTTSQVLVGACSEMVKKGAEEIYLMLSSPGGTVIDGLMLHNTLRALPVKLITHNMGSVNSIANVIFLAEEIRYACPNTSFMFHGVGFDVNQPTLTKRRRILDSSWRGGSRSSLRRLNAPG